MKAHPIIFSQQMLTAILEGRKTQTRRIVTCRFNNHEHRWGDAWVDPGGTDLFGPGPYLKLPYHHVAAGPDEQPTERVRCPYGYPQDGGRLWVKENWTANGKKRSSRFMPRALCRLELEIVAVRCQRLGDITAEDTRAEGVPDLGTFRALWNRLNGPRGFDYASNPWVWVVEFKPERITEAAAR